MCDMQHGRLISPFAPDRKPQRTCWLLQLKGKAAIDVICNPLGKSGGALIQQFMIISFGSLAASTPYLGGILLVIVLLWLNAARSLDKQFSGARGHRMRSHVRRRI